MISVIAFDGDDTLWHNERIFSMTQQKFRDLLSVYVEGERLDERLAAIELHNLGVFGYGIKGFVLSMIETAIDVSEGQVPASIVQALIDFGKEMLRHPVELLDGVDETVRRLALRHRLILITKGDLFDQESKVARSGLADLFWKIEIVSEKDERTYARLLEEHDIDPAQFIMVGNSIKSDILPVVRIGARAVHVPYEMTWVHERAELDPEAATRVWTLESVRDLPPLIARLSRRAV